MPLVQQIQSELPEAMRSGDTRRRDILRLLIAAFNNARIALGHELNDDEAVQTLQREAKQRRESIEQFAAGGRQDLVDHEQDELDLILSYLPADLTEQELRALVAEVVADVGASSPKDLGKVMGPVMKRVSGRADGTLVNTLVREALTQA
jgi:uncharacterized protein YqeY